MIAKRRRSRFATEDEAAQAALAAVPISHENPAAYWGPDWSDTLQQSLDDVAAGRVERFSNEDELLAALERLQHECQPMSGRPDSGATSNP